MTLPDTITQVRLLIGDNNVDEPLLTDAEITLVHELINSNDPYAIGAECCRILSARNIDEFPENKDVYTKRAGELQSYVAIDLFGDPLDDSGTSPTTPGGSGVDQTARDQAQQAQREIDTHERSTHNTDQTARDEADAANTKIDTHIRDHPSGPGGGVSSQDVDAKIKAHKDDSDAHHTPPDLTPLTGRVKNVEDKFPIKTPDIGDDQVTQDKLASESVGSRELKAEAVTEAILADGAVTGLKIPRNTITEAHIGENQVGASEIKGKAVGTTEIADRAVGKDQLKQEVIDELGGGGSGGAGTGGGEDLVFTTHTGDSAVTLIAGGARGDGQVKRAFTVSNLEEDTLYEIILTLGNTSLSQSRVAAVWLYKPTSAPPAQIKFNDLARRDDTDGEFIVDPYPSISVGANDTDVLVFSYYHHSSTRTSRTFVVLDGGIATYEGEFIRPGGGSGGGLTGDQVDARADKRIQRFVNIDPDPNNLEDAIEVLFRDNFEFTDLPGVPSIGAPQIGQFFSVRNVDTTTGTITLAWANPPGGAVSALVDTRYIPHLVTAVNSTTIAGVTAAIAGEKMGDLAIGYDAMKVSLFRYTTEWVELTSWSKTGGGGGGVDIEDVNNRIQAEVAAWALQGNADSIPGNKTFDGLFRAGGDADIAGASAAIAFKVDANVEDTEAAGTSFNITQEQANQAGSYLTAKYVLTTTAVAGDPPVDLELLYQVRDTGVIIARHNLKILTAAGSEEGHVHFPVGEVGAKRWAIRVGDGHGGYEGRITISEVKYHSSEPLADDAVKRIIAPEFNTEKEERQRVEKDLQTEIEEAKNIVAITDALPIPSGTVVKKAIVWQSSPPFRQAVNDAHQAPATGYVQIIVGNFGATPITPVEYCVNRREIIYAQGTIEISVNWDAQRRAIIEARDGTGRWADSNDIANNATGLVMLTYNRARRGGTDTGSPSWERVLGLTETLASSRDNSVRRALGTISLPRTTFPQTWEIKAVAEIAQNDEDDDIREFNGHLSLTNAGADVHRNSEGDVIGAAGSNTELLMAHFYNPGAQGDDDVWRPTNQPQDSTIRVNRQGRIQEQQHVNTIREINVASGSGVATIYLWAELVGKMRNLRVFTRVIA